MGTTTGDALLFDSGQLAYNSVVFSVLFRSEINGEVRQDDAGRQPKFCEYTLSAEGICSAFDDIPLEENFRTIKELLEQSGGELTYRGRGFGNLVVNPPGGGGVRDLAWGPKPEVLFFQPLGNGKSAMVKWRCKFSLLEGRPIAAAGQWNALTSPLQFSYSCAVSYDDECYATVTNKGVLEVGLGSLNVSDVTIPTAVADSYRQRWLDMGVDLTKFRVVKRSFDESADRRKIQWEYSFEQLPPQNLPPGATRAKGVLSVQPVRPSGQKSMLLLGVVWSCSLKVTQSIRPDFTRRQAVWNFLQLLQFHMAQSSLGVFPNMPAAPGGGQVLPGLAAPIRQAINNFRAAQNAGRGQALLCDFRLDQPLYQDSRSTSCEATWILFTTFRTLLDATGVWRWPQVHSATVAAQNLRDISGWRSQLACAFNPRADVLVDFGGGANPPFGNPSGV